MKWSRSTPAPARLQLKLLGVHAGLLLLDLTIEERQDRLNKSLLLLRQPRRRRADLHLSSRSSRSRSCLIRMAVLAGASTASQRSTRMEREA
eukprot:762784-Hanusia_phi.AAC.3